MTLPNKRQLDEYWGGSWSAWMEDHGVSWADAEPTYEDCPVYNADEKYLKQTRCPQCTHTECPNNPKHDLEADSGRVEE